MAAYQSALAASAPRGGIGADRIKSGTVAALVAAYFNDSSEFNHEIAPVTRQYRRAILERFRAEHGHRPVAKLKAEHVPLLLAGKRPHATRNFLKALRPLMRFAVTVGMHTEDVTASIKVRVPKSRGGYRCWTEDEIARFRACHAVGSRARLAFELLLNTAQRRGDVIRMGRQHFRDGVVHVRQAKTGTALSIPILPELQEVLERLPAGGFGPILTVRGGTPFSGTVFSDWFRRMCKRAGLEGLSGHGLRKAACRRLAEAGCTAHEIMAISGHKSLAEVRRYTEAADQVTMARSAAAKVRTLVSNQVSPACQTPAKKAVKAGEV